MAETKSKKIKVRANYPFADVPVGAIQMIWGVPFTHEVVTQKGKEFHVLIAELDAEQAQEMFDCGRVSKA